MTMAATRGASESPTGTSPADAAREIAEFGSAVLRKVWARDDLAVLRDAIGSFCARRAELVERGLLDPMMRQYHAMGVTVLTWLIYEGRIDLGFFAEMFKDSFYSEVCRIHFDDDRLYMAPDRIGSRNIQPPYPLHARLPFHQDSVEQDPRVRRVLNAWIPLDPGAGRTAPGVEVLRHPGSPNFPVTLRQGATGTADYAHVGIGYEDIVCRYGENFLAPEFALGDCLVFSQDVIHRTHITPAMTDPRIGFEFRVFSLKHRAPWASAEDVSSSSFPLF